MGPTALFPIRRKACWRFFRPKNSAASAGCEPANWVPKANMLPLDHRSRLAASCNRRALNLMQKKTKGWKEMVEKCLRHQCRMSVTRKKGALYCWIDGTVFCSLRTCYGHTQHNPARLYDSDKTGITIVLHKHTDTLDWSIKRCLRSKLQIGISRYRRHLCEIDWTHNSSAFCISKQKYETRAVDGHTAGSI
jgi:hypothetical protein